VFAKGGYVCLPMGFAARVFGVPLVIHDSDVLPGLTNRLLSRYADAIGTGMPLENYTYDPAISEYVGVPISADIQAVTPEIQVQYRQDVGLPVEKKVIVAVGGGLGSIVINDAILAAATMLASRDDILFYNITGAKNIQAAKDRSKGMTNYIAEPFIYKDMHKFLGAADVVVTRASATTLQELAGLKKAVIAVPARQLGDQRQNAKLFAKYDAVIALQDDTLKDDLADTVVKLLTDRQYQDRLATNLHQFAKPDAARDMARLIATSVRSRGER
jgi:UDP-N-acetylglucosamine--N-acetylmuramyl-(pentapeptide) pyrophosphoryl-undecaprenol N-acetylglucosamine transferase